MDGLFSPLQIASAGTPVKAPPKTDQQPETREERKLARMRNTGGNLFALPPPKAAFTIKLPPIRTPNSKPGSTHSTPNDNTGPKLAPTTHLPTSQPVASGSSQPQAQASGSDKQQAEKLVARRSSDSRTSGSGSKPQHVSITIPKPLATSPPQPPPAPEAKTQLAATEEELQERRSSKGKLRSLDPNEAEVLDDSTTAAKEKDAATKKAGAMPWPSEPVEVAGNPFDPSHTLHKGLQQAQAAASQSTFPPNSAPAKAKDNGEGKAFPRQSSTRSVQSLDEVLPSRAATRAFAVDADPTPPPLPLDQLKRPKRKSPGTAVQEEPERENVPIKRQKGRRGEVVGKLVEPEEQDAVADEQEVVDRVAEEEKVPGKGWKGRKGKAKVVEAEVEPEEPQEEVAEQAVEEEETVAKRPKGRKVRTAKKSVEPDVETEEQGEEAVEEEAVAEEFVEEAAVAGKRQKGKKGKKKVVEAEVEQDEPQEEEVAEEIVAEKEPVTKRSKGQKAKARRKAVEPEVEPDEEEEQEEEAAQEEEVASPPAKKEAGRKSKDKRDGKRKVPKVAEPEEDEEAPVVPKKRRSVASPSDEEEREVESPPYEIEVEVEAKADTEAPKAFPTSEDDGNGDEDDEGGDNKPRKKKCHFQVDRLLFPSSSVPKLPVAAGNEDDEAATSTSLLKKLRKRASNILTPLDVTWHAIRLTIDQLITVPNDAQPLTPTDQAILTRILSHLRSRVLDLSDLSIAQSMLSRRLYLAKRETKRLQGELMDLRAERREVAVEMEIEERGWRAGKKEREGKRELDQWVRGVEGFKDEWSGEPEEGARKRAGEVDEDPSALEAVLVALAGGLGGEETGMLEGLRNLQGLVKSG